MKTLSFCVPGPPVPKGRPRMTRYGRAFTPAKTRAYQQLVSKVAGDVVERCIDWPMDANYDVTCVFYYGDRRKRDGINVMCAIQDGLNSVAYDDDSQIKDGHYYVRYDKESPRAEITIMVIEP